MSGGLDIRQDMNDDEDEQCADDGELVSCEARLMA